MYPTIHLTGDGRVFCHECAEGEPSIIIASDIYWEGETIECDSCESPIDSAYGIPSINTLIDDINAYTGSVDALYEMISIVYLQHDVNPIIPQLTNRKAAWMLKNMLKGNLKPLPH